MPKGTKVHKIYEALVRGGASKGKAARIAQAKTGKSLATGKAPKGKSKAKHHSVRHGLGSNPTAIARSFKK